MIAPTPEYLTSVEAAREIHRSAKTVRNLVAKHKLARRLVKLGRSRRRAMLLPRESVEELRALCWGDSPLPVKKKVP